MTDPGKVRPSNEDHFLIAHLTKALQIQHTSLPQSPIKQGGDQSYLFVVADGMGGHAGGEKASALVVDSIENFVLDTLKWFFGLTGGEENEVLAEFQSALGQAEAALFAESARHPELSGMGSTLTLAYALGTRLFVAHVGDSRCYLYHGGRLQRLTHDHTMVQDLVRAGQLRPEDAERNALRHVITNVVGGHTPGVQVEVQRVDLAAGDRLLLCSDGLTEMVPDGDIAGVLRDEQDPRGACENLVARANRAGGRDNVTVVVAHFG
jgi:protein phosphatase